MKNIIKCICYTMFIGLLITSCDDNEDYTGASKISYSDTSITVTSSQDSYTFVESLIDEDNPSTNKVTINASIAEPQQITTVVTFVQTSGNANQEDYSIGEIKILAGQTTGSTNLEILKTGDIEGTETFNLKAVSDANSVLNGDFNIAITIKDYINDVLEFSTNWSGEYMYEAGSAQVTLDFCEMDFDVLLFTSAGDFVQSLGATGSCTETGSMSELADGDYYLVIDLYDNPHAVFGATETVPITVSYNQEHFASGSFTNNSFNLSSDVGLTAIAVITKSGYNYTVTPL